MTVESVMIVRMIKQSGPLNPGDIAGLPVSKAQRLIADKVAVEMVVGVDVDADGQPLHDFGDQSMALVDDEDDDSSGGGSNSGGNAGDVGWKFDKTTDPFVNDGVSVEASKALHKVGLHTVDAVHAFIASAPEGQSPAERVKSIDDVSDKQAEKIVSLYGATE